MFQQLRRSGPWIEQLPIKLRRLVLIYWSLTRPSVGNATLEHDRKSCIETLLFDF
jgi:hypothetical protein